MNGSGSGALSGAGVDGLVDLRGQRVHLLCQVKELFRDEKELLVLVAFVLDQPPLVVGQPVGKFQAVMDAMMTMVTLGAYYAPSGRETTPSAEK